jgi:hypothetical protein
MREPWPDGTFGQTRDDLLYARRGAVDNDPRTAQAFWWDSYGRFRLSTQDADAPILAYRDLSIGFATDAPSVPKNLLQISLAGGVHLGEIAGGNVGVLAGAGWTGNSPFSDSNGIFGIVHVLYDRALSDRDTLLLSLDYDGSSAFLPDVPLPGIGLAHRGQTLSYTIGFPRDSVTWQWAPQASISATYTVPYNLSIWADYWLSDHWSVFVGGGNNFESFALRGQSATNRLFYQMRRVFGGVRYSSPDFWHGMQLDVSIGIGYAFDQDFYRGFDVRNLRHSSGLADEPGLFVMMRSTF